MSLSTGGEQSPLLRLPGELRTKIYKYVLTSPFGVVCAFRPRFDSDYPCLLYPWETSERDLPTTRQLNQLKFCSRQLYRETTGLALAWNDIYFPHDADDRISQIMACANFLDACSPVQRAKIRSIYVQDRGPLVIAGINNLGKLVGYVNPLFRVEGGPFDRPFDLEGIHKLEIACDLLPHITINVCLLYSDGYLTPEKWVLLRKLYGSLSLLTGRCASWQSDCGAIPKQSDCSTIRPRVNDSGRPFMAQAAGDGEVV